VNHIDLNEDGCDQEDPGLTKLQYRITDNVTGRSEIRSDDMGTYYFKAKPGTYQIRPQIDKSLYTVTPEVGNIVITENESEAYLDFCLEKVSDKNDLEVILIPYGSPRPGYLNRYWLSYKNVGNTKLSGEISLNFDNDRMKFIKTEVEAESLDNGQMIWKFEDLLPSNSIRFRVDFEMNRPTDTEFPLVGGEKLKFEVKINPYTVDDEPDNNEFILDQTVVNSFDPNDITCLEGDSISFLKTGEYVHYMVRFENTGTAEAVNIVVKDTINTDKFDLESLRPMEGSHDYMTKVKSNGIVEFIFENINLPFTEEGKHGFVVFKIKTKESLIEGDQFENSAAIYFDYNFPIFTNEFETQVVGVALPVKLSSFNADQREDEVHLNWVVQSEENLSHYIVERRHESEDDFRSVDRVTTSDIAAYTATDEDLMSQGIYYYRLNMVDNDGGSQLSDVVTVNYSKRTEALLVYPNPASDYLVIENGYASTTIVTILNAAGQEVSNFKVSKRTKKEIDISSLNKGLHFVSFYRDGALEVKKIFIDK